MKSIIQSKILRVVIGVGVCAFLFACGSGICSLGSDGKCLATTESCPAIIPGNATIMNGALSTIITAKATADAASNSALTVPGDTYSASSGGMDLTISRLLPTSSFASGTITVGSYTASVNVSSDVFSGGSATMVDHDVFTYATNILSSFYAPSQTWHSPLVAYRLIDASATAVEFSSLNSSGSSVAVNLPCDTSACTTQCTCHCYRWNFITNRWTQSGVTTTQGSNTVSCTSFLPVAYLTSFAVQNGCE